MRPILLSCVLIVSLIVVKSNAEAQFNYGYPPMPNYFRSGPIAPSINDALPSAIANEQLSQQGRLFFTTLTLTYTTSTSTVTSTVSTVCTTSTSALKVCTPSGRRRRSVAGGRGLFYSDHDAQNEEGSIFLPSKPETVEVAPVEETRVVRKAPAETAIPYVVQPGFNVPDGVPSGRFLLAFGTTTTTVTSTTTYVSSLTAICQSTTAYQLCGSTGK